MPASDPFLALRASTPVRRGAAWLRVVLIAAAVVGVAAVAVQLARPSLPEVTAVVVEEGPVVVDWAAPGYVEARTAELSAPAPGRVMELPVREGEAVRRGRLVVRLADEEEQAAADGLAFAGQAALASEQAAQLQFEEQRRVLHAALERSRAEHSAAISRMQAAVTALARDEAVLGAAVAAAKAEEEAARQQVAELEAGSRPAEIQRAEAGVTDARAAHRRASIELARQETLVREGAAPRRALDDARENMARTQAAVIAAESTLRLAREGARQETRAAARARLDAARQKVG
jgi:HlyD family secretion protein